MLPKVQHALRCGLPSYARTTSQTVLLHKQTACDDEQLTM